MSFLKKTFYRAVSAVPVAALKRTKAVNLLLPYHHLVANEPVNHVRYIFPYKNEQEFIRDLDYLLAHFHPVHPDDLIRAMRSGDPIKPGGFLLSFDDGFRQVYDVVMPLLLRKGIPAVFFLNPAFLDNRMLFYRNKISLILHALALQKPSPAIANEIKRILSAPDDDESMISQKILAINSRNSRLADQLGNCLEISFDDYLSQQRPYLTNNQVAQLVEKGFHVGGHSLDHPNYKYIGLDEQIYQTRESCAIVRKRNGLDYSLFSFPHEDAPLPQVFFDELARSPGERIDALFGTQNQLLENNNRVLHRFNAERPEYPFEGLVKGVLLYNLQKKIRNRQLVQRPQTLPISEGNRLNEI